MSVCSTDCDDVVSTIKAEGVEMSNEKQSKRSELSNGSFDFFVDFGGQD